MAMTGPRDFSLPMDPKPFRIDPDDFEAPPLLAPMVLRNLGRLHTELGDQADIEKTLTLVSDMFAMVLPGPSGERFRARLLTESRAADPETGRPADPPPIDLVRQALPVLYWLLEEYGIRPTEPSSPSPNGSTDGAQDTPSGGISSTDGASAETSAILT
jgi:hypothetical protein